MPAQRALVEQIVASHAGRALSIEEVVGRGEVNQVFRVETAGGALIVRAHDAAELDRFRKEAWCIGRAAQLGVPGPEVLMVGVAGSSAFMLMTCLAGRGGDELPAVTAVDTWHQLGGYLRVVHSVHASDFGDTLDALTGPDRGAWARYLDYNQRSLTHDDPLLGLGVLTPATARAARERFSDLARLPLRFALAHGDASLKNTMVRADGLVQVIDWGSAHAHVAPHYDFGTILSDSLSEQSPEFAALLDGYGMTRPEWSTIREQVRAVQLLEALDKVRWALDRSPGNLDRLTRQARAVVAQLPEAA